MEAVPMTAGDGCVVVAGVFPAGTACNLVKVAGPEVLRAEGGEWLGARRADDAAVVGFDGLEVGGSYFVAGYVNGELVELRAKGHRPEEVNEFLAQPPIDQAAQTVGTQQAPMTTEAGAVRTELEVGLPASLAAQVPTPENEEPEGHPRLEDVAVSIDGSGEGSSSVPDAAGQVMSIAKQPESGTASLSPSDAEGFTDVKVVNAEPHSMQKVGLEFREPDQTSSEGASPAASATAAAPSAEAAGTEATASASGSPAAQSSDAASASQVTPSESSAGASASEPAPAADSSGAAPAEGANGSAAEPAATDSGAPSAWDQLLAQANGLDVPNADSLSDEELRQAITDKGATPVA